MHRDPCPVHLEKELLGEPCEMKALLSASKPKATPLFMLQQSVISPIIVGFGIYMMTHMPHMTRVLQL